MSTAKHVAGLLLEVLAVVTPMTLVNEIGKTFFLHNIIKKQVFI